MSEDLYFKSLELTDKSIFENAFAVNQPEISEYTFTNLYVWRRWRSIEFGMLDEGIVIRAFDENAYFLPPWGYKNIRRIYELVVGYAKKKNIQAIFKRVPENHISELRQSDWVIIEDRNNFDYVYKTQNLAHLKGRRYDGKRGHIRKFYSQYEFEFRAYDPSMRDSCLVLAQEWIKRKAHLDSSGYREYEAIIDLLENWNELDCDGYLVLDQNKVIAMSFGERLNDSTYVIHFEKADTQYEGAFQAINQRMIQENVLGKFEYVNREQDLGVMGIRKAKLSYSPDHLVKKYIVYAK